MTFLDPPATAAWRHVDSRGGFEVVYFHADDHAITLEGVTAATEEGRTWVVDYTIEIDRSWTRRATVRGRSSSGPRTTVLEVIDGNWLVDGLPVARTDDAADHHYDYTAPAFGVSVQLEYDRYGLVVDYPGIARRAS